MVAAESHIRRVNEGQTMAGIKWSRGDKAKAKALLKSIADKVGGWQALADELGMTSDGSRGTVQAWHRRGRVSLEYVAAVRNLASKHNLECALGALNPQAKHLETVQ